ncbi:hypothetical protein, partial [Mesorhizobium sp.]|uniref:hypothetical protein n=1 Tax=Mesorhizobium sp. TaxID=1871066 RepID=UPI0025F505CE
AENFPRHHRVQLLQRIARLAQPNTTPNNVPEPSLPHVIASAQNQRGGLNQKLADLGRFFEASCFLARATMVVF